MDDLYQNLATYARKLQTGRDREPVTVYPEYAGELIRWLEERGETPPAGSPGPADWCG